MAKRAASKQQRTPKPKRIPQDSRVVLLTGSERLLKSIYIDTLRKDLESTHAAVDLIRFDGSSAAVSDILDECRSFSLMAQHKIVVVDSAEELVKASKKEEDGDSSSRGSQARPPRKLLEAYCDHPSESACLVLLASNWRPGNLDKSIDAVGNKIHCEFEENDVDRNWVTNWVGARALRRHERQIGKQAINELIGRVGLRLGALDSEIAKLAATTTPDQMIDIQLIEQFVGVSREQNVYDIQLLAMTAPPEKTLAKLRDILANDAPIRVRFAMTDLAKKLHAAARWLEGSRTGPRPNLWPRAVADAVMHAASNAPPSAFADLLAQAVEADQRAKSSQGDESRTLEILVLRFAAICRR